uniref:Uncharacterized protein n=1 Tax=Dulem virus 32 TaxID=3145750 RepID=A0AAU8B0J1_9CAUD
MELRNTPSNVAKRGHGHAWPCKVTKSVTKPLPSKPALTRHYNIFITFMDQSRVREFTGRRGHGHVWPRLSPCPNVAKNNPAQPSKTVMTQPALFATDTHPARTPSGQPNTRTDGQPYHWAKPGGWRAATPTRCPHCKQHILRGYNANQGAFLAAADPTPLTALGEALTLLGGGGTLTLTRTGTGALILTRRNANNITATPAGSPRQDILPRHRCQQPPLPAPAYTEPQIKPPQDPWQSEGPPPF